MSEDGDELTADGPMGWLVFHDGARFPPVKTKSGINQIPGRVRRGQRGCRQESRRRRDCRIPSRQSERAEVVSPHFPLFGPSIRPLVLVAQF